MDSCCIAVLPDGVEPGPDLSLDELWFAVYLEGGVDRKRKPFVKVAWFYTQDQVEEVLYPLSRRKEQLLNDVQKLPVDGLILTTHWDIIEIESISTVISMQHGNLDNPRHSMYYSSLLHFGELVPQLHYTYEATVPQLRDGSVEDVEEMLSVAINGVAEDT
ncbi:hypothetical protein FRB90_008363 [Tulasnella sp. 427]|nr:hypothetical protein FRB90_008363 [Tulasnella sp. 427]